MYIYTSKNDHNYDATFDVYYPDEDTTDVAIYIIHYDSTRTHITLSQSEAKDLAAKLTTILEEKKK